MMCLVPAALVHVALPCSMTLRRAGGADTWENVLYGAVTAFFAYRRPPNVSRPFSAVPPPPFCPAPHCCLRHDGLHGDRIASNY